LLYRLTPPDDLSRAVVAAVHVGYQAGRDEWAEGLTDRAADRIGLRVLTAFAKGIKTAF
jgi:hypothetical protein